MIFKKETYSLNSSKILGMPQITLQQRFTLLQKICVTLEQAKTWQAQRYRDETQNLLADFFLGCPFLWHIEFQESCWWGDLNPPCFLVHKRYNLLHKWNPDLNISTAIYCRGEAHSQKVICSTAMHIHYCPYLFLCFL